MTGSRTIAAVLISELVVLTLVAVPVGLLIGTGLAKGIVTAANGKVHRVEDWGRRQLAYQIQKLGKAHYLCLNIEVTKETLVEIETGFKFNDAVLRHLTVAKAKAETTPSVMMKAVEREEARKAPAPQEASA